MSSELITFKTKSSTNVYIEIDIPYTCVHCMEKMKPHIVFTSTYDDKLKTPVALLFQCTHCFKYFACEYEVLLPFQNSISAYKSQNIPYSYKLLATFDLPVEVSSISPSFEEIYLQSLTAEKEGLNQICGIGYRKAIEFLIKDFLIYFQKLDKDEVSKITLGQAIKQINSDKIKTLSTASVWLGNDETHYIKKYENRDIEDMKKFLKALAYFISSEIVASDANDFINS